MTAALFVLLAVGVAAPGLGLLAQSRRIGALETQAVVLIGVAEAQAGVNGSLVEAAKAQVGANERSTRLVEMLARDVSDLEDRAADIFAIHEARLDDIQRGQE